MPRMVLHADRASVKIYRINRQEILDSLGVGVQYAGESFASMEPNDPSEPTSPKESHLKSEPFM
jgi:hypothetical protein